MIFFLITTIDFLLMTIIVWIVCNTFSLIKFWIERCFDFQKSNNSKIRLMKIICSRLIKLLFFWYFHLNIVIFLKIKWFFWTFCDVWLSKYFRNFRDPLINKWKKDNFLNFRLSNDAYNFWIYHDWCYQNIEILY